MTETAATTPALPGLLSRAIGIITSPKATFELVVKSPRALGILALSALVMGGAQSAFTLTARGQQAVVDLQEQQIEKFTHTPVTPDQDAAMRRRAPYAPITTVIGLFIFMPIALLIVSGVLFVVFNVILGGTAEFKQVMAVCSHTLVISAVSAVFGMIMAFSRGAMSTSPANIGLLLPMLPEGSFLASFLGFIDLFNVWGIVVTSIGLGVLYRRKTANIAIGLFAFYAVVGLTVAYFISR